MSELLFIAQTLHGYLDGHQLLASSTDLSTEEQSFLLIISDLSGPAFRSGYESYLTGYSLPNSHYYCVARTWFAPELPRPGCVWTQTFLIRAEDLARISSFDHLNELFSRPADPVDFSRYQQHVILDLNLTPIPRPAVESRPVLRSIYGTDKRVVIPSENSWSFESLILAIFEQQWPRLRRGFKFCTGALSLRDTEFDLSVSPPEVTHAVSDAGLVISEYAQEISEKEDDWLEIAVRDLELRQGKSDYREFLWRFGPDNVDGRSAFRPLTEIFSVLISEDDGFRREKLLSATNYFYATPTSASRLKTELFGKGGRFIGQLGREEDLLRLIVTHPNASALPGSATQLISRSAELAANDPLVATDIAILASEMGGENADQYLEGYLSQEIWSDSILKDMPAGLLLRVIAKHPGVVARSAIWLRSDSVTLVLRILPAIASDIGVLQPTLSAVINAASWSALSYILRNVGEPVATLVFELIDSGSDRSVDLPDQLVAELAEHHDIWGALAQQDRLAPRSLRLLSSELDPRAWHVRRLGIKHWVRLLEAPASFENPERELRSWVFCLALGLSSDAQKASALVRESFKPVYDAGLKDGINVRLWQELEPHLTWYSPSWDKCARLVRSAAKAYFERDWNHQDFLNTFSSEDLLEQALREVDRIYRGYKYIRQLREDVSNGRLTVTANQRRTLMH